MSDYDPALPALTGNPSWPKFLAQFRSNARFLVDNHHYGANAYAVSGSGIDNQSDFTDSVLTPQFALPTGAGGTRAPQAGDAIEWAAYGKFGTTGTPTLEIRPQIKRAGGTVQTLASISGTTGSGVSNKLWSVHGITVIRTAGASAILVTRYTWAAVEYGTSKLEPMGGQVGAAFDLTDSPWIELRVLWSAASVSNSITLDAFHAELIRGHVIT